MAVKKVTTNNDTAIASILAKITGKSPADAKAKAPAVKAESGPQILGSEIVMKRREKGQPAYGRGRAIKSSKGVTRVHGILLAKYGEAHANAYLAEIEANNGFRPEKPSKFTVAPKSYWQEHGYNVNGVFITRGLYSMADVISDKVIGKSRKESPLLKAVATTPKAKKAPKAEAEVTELDAVKAEVGELKGMMAEILTALKG